MRTASILCLFLLVLCGPTTCLFFGDNSRMHLDIIPKDPYVIEGEELRMLCTLDGPTRGLTSHEMYFEYNVNGSFQLVPEQYQRVVNSSVLELLWPAAPFKGNIYFYCLLNRSSLSPPENNTLVALMEVSFQPMPQAISHLNCVSDNTYSMTCDWCQQVEPDVRYELYWRISSSYFGKCLRHLHHTIHQSVVCGCVFCKRQSDASMCGNSNQTDLYTALYSMNVTASRKVGTVQTVFQVDPIGSETVKPRPPLALTASSMSSRGVVLKWSSPPDLQSFSDIFSLEYTVDYKCKWDKQPLSVTTFNKSVTLESLHPYCSYDVNLTAIPYPDGKHISDPAKLTFETLADSPSVGPVMLPGVFWQTPAVTETDAPWSCYIFWKDIPERDMNGEINHYRVCTENVAVNLQHCENYTPRNSHRLEHLKANSAYKISVEAGTQQGAQHYSPPVYLNIPQTVIAPPAYIDGVVNDSRVVLTIRPPEGFTVTSYTLLWCKGRPSGKVCIGAPEMLSLSGDTKEYVLSGHTSDRMYFIAANTADSSSGLQPVNLCFVGGDLRQVNIEFPQDQPKSGLTMKWRHLFCDNFSQRVTSYQVTVRGASDDNKDYHFEDTKRAVYGQNEFAHTLNKLTANSWYNVTIQACSDSVCGTPLEVPRKIQGIPMGPGRIAGIVIGIILIGVAIFVIYRCIVWCQRKIVVNTDIDKDYSAQHDEESSADPYTKVKEPEEANPLEVIVENGDSGVDSSSSVPSSSGSLPRSRSTSGSQSAEQTSGAVLSTGESQPVKDEPTVSHVLSSAANQMIETDVSHLSSSPTTSLQVDAGDALTGSSVGSDDPQKIGVYSIAHKSSRQTSVDESGSSSDQAVSPELEIHTPTSNCVPTLAFDSGESSCNSQWEASAQPSGSASVNPANTGNYKVGKKEVSSLKKPDGPPVEPTPCMDSVGMEATSC